MPGVAIVRRKFLAVSFLIRTHNILSASTSRLRPTCRAHSLPRHIAWTQHHQHGVAAPSHVSQHQQLHSRHHCHHQRHGVSAPAHVKHHHRRCQHHHHHQHHQQRQRARALLLAFSAQAILPRGHALPHVWATVCSRVLVAGCSQGLFLGSGGANPGLPSGFFCCGGGTGPGLPSGFCC